MQRLKWIDRRFTFDFPVETYPELLERLRGTPIRVAERLRPVPRERLLRRSGTAWSMQEHAGHLADLDDRLFLPRLDEYEFKVATLRAADMTNRATEEANHNASTLEAVLAALAAARARVMSRLEGFEPDVFARTALHPRLGRDIRLVDLLYFHAEHDDYHLASVTALLRA